jgi:hypothetical protein
MKIYFGIHFATCFSIWGSMTLTCKQYSTVTPLVSENTYVEELHGGNTNKDPAYWHKGRQKQSVSLLLVSPESSIKDE